MDRIIAALIFCFMLATALAIAVGARVVFDLPDIASIVIGGALLLIFSLTQGVAVQRRHHGRLENQISDIADTLESIHRSRHSWNTRLQVCEERLDLLIEDRANSQDVQARADIAELGALIKDMVDAMGDVDLRLQNHGRLLTSLPSQQPSQPPQPAPVSEKPEVQLPAQANRAEPIPEENEQQILQERDLKAERLSALRRALNSNAITLDYSPVVRLPRRQVWAHYTQAELNVPGETDQMMLRQIAADNGLMPCIDLLMLSQAARGPKSEAPDQETAPVICPISLESFRPNPFSEALEEALESQRDQSQNIILEFPDTAMTSQLAANARDSESTALRARLKRYARWGYRYSLEKNARVGLAADYGMLAELGFRYVRISAKPLIAAVNAIDNGEKAHFDLHPLDLSGLVARYAMDLIVSGLHDEKMVLEALELNASYATGLAFQVNPARRAS